ncbi:MAG: phosphopyruvate hydratase [Gammaproteobacteria bacterium]
MSGSQIERVHALEIIDSRGNPTVEVRVTLKDGSIGCASVPSGASTGAREAVVLRDKTERYLGKGVETAVANVNTTLAEALYGKCALGQADIDQTMLDLDGTPNKGKLGANSILAVSLAVLKAAAAHKGLELYSYISTLIGGDSMGSYTIPVPMMNILNGGAHADNNVDIQEFMIMPVGAPNFKEGLRYGVEIYHTLKKVLSERGLSTGVGDEGGFAPNLDSNEQALQLILEAVEKAGYQAGSQIVLALDCAASEFYREGHYHVDGKALTAVQWVDELERLSQKYPIRSIEDALHEDDWNGWRLATERLGNRIQLVGDDLFTTNVETLKKGIDQQVANALLTKPNQIGTFTETKAAVLLAQENAYNTILSHRSGETGDTTIADLAVALQTGQIKTGAPCRSDRTEKYNRLLRIEGLEREGAPYPGSKIFETFAS